MGMNQLPHFEAVVHILFGESERIIAREVESSSSRTVPSAAFLQSAACHAVGLSEFCSSQLCL